MTIVPLHRSSKDFVKTLNLLITWKILSFKSTPDDEKTKVITNIISNLLSGAEIPCLARSLRTKFLTLYQNPSSKSETVNVALEGGKLIMCSGDVIRAVKEIARLHGYQISPNLMKKVDQVSSVTFFLYSFWKGCEAAGNLKKGLSPEEMAREGLECYKHVMSMGLATLFIEKAFFGTSRSPETFTIVETLLQPAKTISLYGRADLLLGFLQTKVEQGQSNQAVQIPKTAVPL